MCSRNLDGMLPIVPGGAKKGMVAVDAVVVDVIALVGVVLIKVEPDIAAVESNEMKW